MIEETDRFYIYEKGRMKYGRNCIIYDNQSYDYIDKNHLSILKDIFDKICININRPFFTIFRKSIIKYIFKIDKDKYIRFTFSGEDTTYTVVDLIKFDVEPIVDKNFFLDLTKSFSNKEIIDIFRSIVKFMEDCIFDINITKRFNFQNGNRFKKCK
jgi:hypothetical protein